MPAPASNLAPGGAKPTKALEVSIMSNITHWNPFKQLARFENAAPFEDLLRGFGMRPMWRDLETAPDIRIDVSEDDKSFRIKAEVPGVKKEDIEVSVDGNQVAISAEVKREMQNKQDEKQLYSERYVGRVYRSFSLSTDLDSGKADAHYDNGVLTLVLPKKANGSSKKIVVS
jgi:HSP20 family protein